MGARFSLLTLFLYIGTANATPPEPSEFQTELENQLGLTFTPDGQAAYWTAWNGQWAKQATSLRSVYMSRLDNGEWSPPTLAPFSGQYNDDDPFVSPNGEWVYFVSDRPITADGHKTKGDLWRYHVSGTRPPEHLPVSSSAAEYSPVVTASGNLYFASAREGGLGQGDLYRCLAESESFLEPENLGAAINSPTGEWNLWVSADETEIIFEASSRPSNISNPGDLYYSWKSNAGWVPAMPVTDLNDKNSELMPRLHPAGDTLYFGVGTFGGHARVKTANWQVLRNELHTRFAPKLLVANRSSHEVTEVDLQSGQVTFRYATGEGPHLLSNVSGGKVLASGYGEFPRPHAQPVAKRPPFEQTLNARLTLIDTRERVTEWVVQLENCKRPHASWLVGNRGYVTCEDERQIVEIDIAEGSETGRFDTLQDGSHVLAYAEKFGLLSVSNTDSGSITLIDIASSESAVLELAAGSEGALTHEDRIWVANGMNGSVSIIDPEQKNEIQRVEDLCSFPIAMSANRTGQVWLACFASSEIIALNDQDYSVENRINISGKPLNILLHPEHAIAYVSLPRDNAVAEINLDTGALVRKIPVGIEPDGLRWSVR